MGADNFFALFGLPPAPNLLRAFLQPGPLRASVVNWAEVAQTLMRLLHHELARHPNKEGAAKFATELQAPAWGASSDGQAGHRLSTPCADHSYSNGRG